MSQLSLEDICLSFCRDTALEILALRQQGGGFLPCLTTKILRIYSSRFNWYINSNLMTEEIVVAIVSQASGAALQMLLPAVPFAYMAGCMAGGMLATAGLQAVKDMVMEVKDGGGFEAIVPANTVQTMNVITDKISDLHITDQLSGFKDTVISTANNGYISIKSKVS